MLLQLVKGFDELLAIAQALGGELGRQLQRGNARLAAGAMLEAEGVEEVAERTAPFADDGLLTLVQLAADYHVGGQPAAKALGLGDDGAGGRLG